MTTIATTAPTVTRQKSSGFAAIWRIVRLHFVNPGIFIGTPWFILGAALALSILIFGIITQISTDGANGGRYSWAVLAPQWYLVSVGVQAIATTFGFALGFGATRRDYWLGTSLTFVLVSVEMALAIATLVQIEKATGGWWLKTTMFDALWYGTQGWLFDFYSTFAMQLLVLFIGAAFATFYLRWRMWGVLFSLVGLVLIVIGTFAGIVLTRSSDAVGRWLTEIGLTGVFTVVLVIAALFTAIGYLVIRRGTPR